MARVTKGGTEFDPAALDRAEKRFWRDQWDAVPALLAREHGVLRADFGPVQATIATAAPTVSVLNLVLDAASGDAAAEGFLAAAVEWARERGVRACVPVTPGLPGSARAAEWLAVAGFAPRPGWMKFVRDAHPPRFETAPGIEVVAVGSEGAGTAGAGGASGSEGAGGARVGRPRAARRPGADALPFAAIATAAFELPAWTADLFAPLPARPDWRCYVALVDGEPQACAAMLLAGEIAELGIGGTLAGGRRRGCQLALLRRRIEDAAAAGARTLFVETGERVPGHPSSSYANILRAGFEEAYLCPGFIDARPAAD